MGIMPQLLIGKVMHGRLFPRRNHFTYGIYYLAFFLSQRTALPIAYNKPAILSFHEKDHGDCQGGDLEKWARDILAHYHIDQANGDICLVCLPRIFGYVFNPVSFWLCYNLAGDLIAVLCEVHNTFGERHTYLCVKEDQKPITKDDILSAQKVFHVSPFIQREGSYEFRFDFQKEKIAIWIDYYNAENKKQLVTSLIGDLKPMTKETVRYAFWRYPLITVKAIMLIHWQALKLIVKGIKYISKPKQKQELMSKTEKITKM